MARRTPLQQRLRDTSRLRSNTRPELVDPQEQMRNDLLGTSTEETPPTEEKECSHPNDCELRSLMVGAAYSVAMAIKLKVVQSCYPCHERFQLLKEQVSTGAFA